MSSTAQRDTVHIFIDSAKVNDGKYNSACIIVADGKQNIRQITTTPRSKQTRHTSSIYGLARVLKSLPTEYRQRPLIVYLAKERDANQKFIALLKNIEALKKHTIRSNHPGKKIAYSSFVDAILQDEQLLFQNLQLRTSNADNHSLLDVAQKFAASQPTLATLKKATEAKKTTVLSAARKKGKTERPTSTRKKVRSNATKTPKQRPTRLVTNPAKIRKKSPPKPSRKRTPNHSSIEVKVVYKTTRSANTSMTTNISALSKSRHGKKATSKNFKTQYGTDLAALKATLLGLKMARDEGHVFTLTTPSQFFSTIYTQAKQDFEDGQKSLADLDIEFQDAKSKRDILKAKKDANKAYSKSSYTLTNKKITQLRALRAGAKRSVNMIIQDLIDETIEANNITPEMLDTLEKIKKTLSKIDQPITVKYNPDLIRCPNKEHTSTSHSSDRSTTSHTLCVSFQYVVKNGTATLYAACHKTWEDSASGKHKTDSAKQSCSMPSKTSTHGIMIEKINLIRAFLDADKAKENRPISIHTNDGQFTPYIKDHPLDDIHIPKLSEAFHYVEVDIIPSQNTADKLDDTLIQYSGHRSIKTL